MEFLVVVRCGAWKTINTTVVAAAITVLYNFRYGLLAADAIRRAGGTTEHVVLLSSEMGMEEWNEWRLK